MIKENRDFNLRTNALFVCNGSPCIQSALFTEREVYGEEAECDTEDMREEKQTQTKDSKIPNEIQPKPGIVPPSLSVHESL
jgi:hypothetical protein